MPPQIMPGINLAGAFQRLTAAKAQPDACLRVESAASYSSGGGWGASLGSLISKMTGGDEMMPPGCHDKPKWDKFMADRAATSKVAEVKQKAEDAIREGERKAKDAAQKIKDEANHVDRKVHNFFSEFHFGHRRRIRMRRKVRRRRV